MSSSKYFHSEVSAQVIPQRREPEVAATVRYRCSSCEFTAAARSAMESHVYRHIPGVTFKCAYCDSEFTGFVSALAHNKNSHSNKEAKVGKFFFLFFYFFFLFSFFNAPRI